MDNQPINIGDCFLFANDEGGTHLHIVIAEDHDDPYGQVMMVYITSTKIFDETTILEAGCHSFVKHTSWVKYNNIQIILRSELRSKIMHRYEHLSKDLIEKIQNGLIKSKRTSRQMKEIYSQWNTEKIFRGKS